MNQLFTFVLFISLISFRAFGQDKIIVNLKCKLMPYTDSRSIEAEIFVNGQSRITVEADNSAYARIYAILDKQKDDSSVEIKIHVYSPKDYSCLEGTSIRYQPNIEKQLHIIDKKLSFNILIDSSAELMNTGNYAEAAILLEPAISNRIYRGGYEEIALKCSLAKNYHVIGKYQDAIEVLSNVNRKRLKVVDKNLQVDYFNSYLQNIQHFVLKNVIYRIIFCFLPYISTDSK